MGIVLAAGAPRSSMATLAVTGADATATDCTLHTLEQRPPGRYSCAVAAQQPQHVATPSSNCKSDSVVAPASTEARTWRSVMALHTQMYMRIIIVIYSHKRKRRRARPCAQALENRDELHRRLTAGVRLAQAGGCNAQRFAVLGNR